MTVAGQSAVNCSYDSADRLAQIAQGTSVVPFSYDAANRRTSLTLPNGIVENYNLDAASELTGINYKLAGNSLGSLTYSYDLAGRRTSVSGSFARTEIPLPVSTTAYNAANELAKWGTANLFGVHPEPAAAGRRDANGDMRYGVGNTRRPLPPLVTW